MGFNLFLPQYEIIRLANLSFKQKLHIHKPLPDSIILLRNNILNKNTLINKTLNRLTHKIHDKTYNRENVTNHLNPKVVILCVSRILLLVTYVLYNNILDYLDN
jgi:hypothetical protein